MRKAVIKGIVFGLTFFIAVIVISAIMNKGNHDMTVEMADATFPVITMGIDGNAYNELHGYVQAMDTAYMRDSITALNDARSAEFTVNTYGEAVTGITYEVRSVDGERLIESTEVREYDHTEDVITGQITVKDLIERNEEYELIFIISTDKVNNIRYYTRMIWPENYYVAEKLQFVKDFSEKTFDKEAVSELARYMETNSEGDNTTLNYVDIHCSLNQVSWGNLEVYKLTEPVFDVTELAEQTATLTGRYFAATGTGDDTEYFYVEEHYRIRYTTDRTYLLDYYRTMNSIVDEDSDIYANNKILLGVAPQDLPLVESGDGNVFVFEAQNRLYSYNVTTNKIAVIFGFYDEAHGDARTIYGQHAIRILNIDEAGNVQFVVYGYMNRGRHEGEVGIQLYNYDSTLNTIEEILYIPYDKTYRILQAEMEKLLYLSRDNYLYLMLDDAVYEVNLTEKICSSVVESVSDESIRVSDDNKMIAWQTGGLYQSEELILMNLGTRSRIHITADEGEVIMPLGFMGEDLVYGIARSRDVVEDNTGRTTFPMYAVYIEDAYGNILKSYEQEGIYIIGCTMQSNQISLERVQLLEDGTLSETTPDYIMNNAETETSANYVDVVTTENYGKYVQIAVKKTIDAKSLQVLTPKEVLYEGGRELILPEKEDKERYYVYVPEGNVTIYSSAAKAIMLADEMSGIVLNDQGDYVWMKGNLSTSNQIMAIEASSETEEKSSLAVCLDTMLKYEGIIRNAEYLLSTGGTAYDILQKNLEDAQILDLKGCSLSAVLYYVNKDIPVLATLNDGSAVLLVGFNQFNVGIMDPSTGTIYKKGLNDSTEWFSESGNSFITYVK